MLNDRSIPPQEVTTALIRKFGDEADKYMKLLQYDGLCDCWMFPYAGMVLGVERDGYIHS